MKARIMQKAREARWEPMPRRPLLELYGDDHLYNIITI